MGRKVHRVPVHLDSKGIGPLSDSEIVLILRGADGLIGSGGRTLLAKILKGSKEKRLLELELHESPAYGALRELSLEQITARIDWLIIKGYLRIEYDYRLPVLVYTRKGWEIEKETFAAEKLARLDRQLEDAGADKSFAWLNEMNPQVMYRILDVIADSGDSRYVPALEQWAGSASRKVRGEINDILKILAATESTSG
jgi:superfamily II DNA helicase RecQ